MPPPDESGDFLLIDETLRGRVRSFSTIIGNYQDRIYTLAMQSIRHREDAKDITQNVFVNAFSNLKKFRKECSFQTWLYRIAINQIKNYWRNKKNSVVIAESELQLAAEKNENRFGTFADAKEAIDSEETKRMVNEMIFFLPPEQRQLFVLYYAAGYTCQEIAEICKTSTSNVKIQLHRGRKFLYTKFQKNFR
jgi:RNA polymerase sigma factor (sigma-70 family)